jgi:uncharacterized membrane protein
MRDKRDLRALHERVEQEMQKQISASKVVFFLISGFLFLIFGLISLFTLEDIALPDQAVGALIMLGVGWGLSVMFQGISLAMESETSKKSMRNSIISRQIGGELLSLLVDQEEKEKPKREMTVGADGELEEVAGDLLTEEDQARRSAYR